MGYNATCDDCGSRCEPAPALLCQFSPVFFRATAGGGYLADLGYDEGDTVTLCGDCTMEVLEDG